MNTSANMMLPLASAGLALSLRLFFLVRFLWNYPLNHGPRFFFDVEVPAGFYEGAGIQWLKRYRILLLIQHLILIASFVILVALRRWSDLPIMAPIDVVTFFSMMGGFRFWVRRRLGGNPPVLSRVAVPLQARRLSDYISWRMETAVVGFLALGWLLFFHRGDGALNWQWPVMITYAVMGMLPLKIIIARGSFPLPPERSEEHYRWLEANKRHSLKVIESMRWFFAVILAWQAVANDGIWWRRLVLVIAIGLFVKMTALLIHGGAALARMGHDLRPVGSWVGPFQPARFMLRGGLAWSVVYCSCLAALLVFFRR